MAAPSGQDRPLPTKDQVARLLCQCRFQDGGRPNRNAPAPVWLFFEAATIAHGFVADAACGIRPPAPWIVATQLFDAVCAYHPEVGEWHARADLHPHYHRLADLVLAWCRKAWQPPQPGLEERSGAQVQA